MAKSAGRKPKLTLEEVQKVIELYRENIKPMGIIAYQDIFKYANQLYKEGIISADTSDNYWRKEGRQGRLAVDKANEINSEVVEVSKGKEINIPNMADLVEKKYKNKDDLLKHLLQVEKMFHQALEREKKQENEITKLQDSLQSAKEQLKAEKENNEKLQGLVFRLHRIASEQPTEEMKKQTEYAMKTTFSEPYDFAFFDETSKTKEVTNVIELDDAKPKKSITSRFRKK